uniref:Uncharacterized protein n=1 Tax=Chrysemys picta bellii TaxID=8478 RepID=A0A8C3I4Z2_CHRPI
MSGDSLTACWLCSFPAHPPADSKGERRLSSLRSILLWFFFFSGMADLGGGFLDPYDGDSEDASTHSDCSLNSLNDINYNRVTPLVHNLSEMGEDIYTSENRGSLHMSSNWVSPITEICDVYMQPENDLKIQMEVITKEKSDVPTRLARPCELSRASGVLASAMWLTSDCSLLMSGDPSKYLGVLESPVTTTLQQPMLAKSDGENTMCDQSIKRKLGLPFLEGVGEKLRRKKLRAT